MSRAVEFHVEPNRILRQLLVAVSALVTLSLVGDFFRFHLGHGRVLGFVPEFNLDTENNIPTYFSGLLLLTSAFLSATLSRSANAAISSYRLHWIGLSGIFAYMSVDEVASLHERLIQPFRTLLDAGGILYFAWVVPAAGLLIVFAFMYFRFWFDLPTQPRFYMGLAGAIYISGALGTELIGGYLADTGSRDGFTYSLVTTVEEALEMTGVTFFIYSLLLLISSYAPVTCLRVKEETLLRD